MLGTSTIYATLAVQDLEKAKDFYGNILGLPMTNENIGGVTYTCGSGKLFVYAAPTGGKNPATSATWEVDDIEAVVDELKMKGVHFEHYDGFPVEWQGDVAVMGEMKMAWFKDVDGNTLAIGQ